MRYNIVKTLKPQLREAATMTTTTSRKPSSKTYTLAELQVRQAREGFCFGFLRHEIHDSHVGPMRAKRVIAWLKSKGFDAVDAYHALNSRTSRHLGDWLMDDGILPNEIERRIASSLWGSPDAMYADFDETREELEKGGI